MSNKITLRVEEDLIARVTTEATADDIKRLEAALATKADLNSPAFTGTPTAPTAETSTNNTQLATTAFVHAMVDDLDYSVITDAEIEALF